MKRTIISILGVLVLLTMFLATATPVAAARNPEWAELDDGTAWTAPSPSTDGAPVTVGPGASIKVDFNVSTTSDWRSTGWSFEGGSPSGCDDHSNYSSGNHTVTFYITAPSFNGTYDLTLHAYNNDSCSSGSSGEFIMTDAVTVTGGAECTGWVNPSSDTDSGVSNEDDAYTDGSGYATFNDDGDNATYYDYSFGAFPSGSTITGITVMLDAANSGWCSGDNNGTFSVELWDGTSWTTAKTQNVNSTSYNQFLLGGTSDDWGHGTWSLTQIGNLRVRVSWDDNCPDGYLDWIPVKVCYSAPACTDNDSDGYTTCDGDCDDGNPAVHPGATEICNGYDDDCDQLIDEGFDNDSDGYTSCGGDCDDNDPNVNPGATEITCNQTDDDCNAATLDNPNNDSDGYGVCDGDCDDNDPSVNPGAPEVCDGIDNDCDQLVDAADPDFTPLAVQLAIVMDGSSSISSGNWNIMRTGVADAVNTCMPQDGSVELTVIQFGGGSIGGGTPFAQIEVGPVVITAANAASVASSISGIAQLGGYTPLACGINLAADTLAAGSSCAGPDTRQIINIVTDGVPNACCDGGSYTRNGCYGCSTDGCTDADTSAINARTYAISQGVDEIDVEGIGITDTNRDWLANNIILPATGYASPPSAWPPPAPGWVRVITTYTEFATTICEKFAIVTCGPCEVYNPDTHQCEPKDCSDTDPCTVDSCNPDTGACEHTPVVCGDCEKCDNGNCVDDPSKDPTADFSADPTSGCSSLTVNFTNASTGATSYSWDFDYHAGDNDVDSTDANPSHAFTSAGTYTVQLTATNNCGSDTHTVDITVTQTPVAHAPDVTLCEGYTFDDLMAAVAPGGFCTCTSACPDCQITLTDNGDNTYTVDCDNNGCANSATGNITVIDCCPECTEPVTLTIISDDSDTTTYVTAGNTGGPWPYVAVLAWEPDSGTDPSDWDNNIDYNFSSSGADWIWESYRVVHPVAGDVVSFQNTVNIPDDAVNITGTIHITCDNGYEVWLDGTTMVGSAQVHNYNGTDWQVSNLTENWVNTDGWQTVEQFSLNGLLHTGDNVFTFECANEQMDGGTISSNPAGLIFEIVINYCQSTCPTASITPDPAETCEGVGLQLHGNPSGGTGSLTHLWTGDGATYLSSTTVEDPTFTCGTPGSYNLTYTVTDEENCQGSDDITVTVHANPDCTITLDTDSDDGAVCENSTGHTASVSAAVATATYTWTLTGDYTNLIDTGTNSITFDAGPYSTGNINVKVEITDGNGCYCTDDVDITVGDTPDCTITLDTDSDDGVCENSTGHSATAADISGATYTWTVTGDATNVVDNGYYVTFDAAAYNTGNINVKVEITTAEGCYCTSNEDIPVYPLPDCTITLSARSVCENSTGLTADVTPVSGATYVWTLTGDYSNLSGDGTASISFDVGAAGTVNVKVEITTAEGCYCTSNVDVTVNDSPVADAGPDQTVVLGGSVGIGGSPTASGGTPGYLYHWEPTMGLSDPNSPNPTASPATTTTYTVTVTDSNGCIDSDSVTVEVIIVSAPGAPGPDKCYLVVDMLGERTLWEMNCCNNTTVEEDEAYDPEQIHFLGVEQDALILCGDCDGCNCYPKIIVMSLSDETIDPPAGMGIVGPIYDWTGYKDIRQELACHLVTYFDPVATVLLHYDPDLLSPGDTNPVVGFFDHSTNQWVILPPATGIVAEPGIASGEASYFASPFAVLVNVEPEATTEPPPPAPDPAHFVASGLNITPAKAKTGETVTISLNVTNDGDETGNYTVELRINGVTTDSQAVTLGGGQSEEVSFQVSASEAGTYQVIVSGLNGSFDVTKSSLWWIYLIIAAVVIIAALLVWRFTRKPASKKA